MESIQHNADSAITGAIRGFSREKLDQELGLESLQQQQWHRKLCYFLKLTKSESAKYLFHNNPTVRRLGVDTEQEKLPTFLSSMLDMFLEIHTSHLL